MTSEDTIQYNNNDLPAPPKIEHLEFLEVLGRGGMGYVFKAKDHRSGKLVAVKLLNPDYHLSEEYVQRFLREAQGIIELSHPNIVKGYEVVKTEDSIYFTMEFIEGIDLRKIVSLYGPLPPEKILDIAKQVAAALSYAYSKGKIHRDIKPANLICTSEGIIKLADFGLIKGETDPSLTSPGIVLGTPHYMSPELVSGCKDIDIRSDIYSLGATLVHLLTGKPPFMEYSPAVIMTKQITDNIEIPAAIDMKSGARFRYILTKMVAKRPELRYQTPDELLDDLNSLECGHEIAAEREFKLQKSQKDDSGRANISDIFTPPTIILSQPAIPTILTEEQIQILQEGSTFLMSFSPGQVLFYEDDNSRDFYILLSGKFEVLRSGKRLALISEPGACFGDIAAILGVKRTATLRAIESSLCLKVPHSKFKLFLAEYPDVQIRLLEINLSRLMDIDEQYVRVQQILTQIQHRLFRIEKNWQFMADEDLLKQVQNMENLIQAGKRKLE